MTGATHSWIILGFDLNYNTVQNVLLPEDKTVFIPIPDRKTVRLKCVQQKSF